MTLDVWPVLMIVVFPSARHLAPQNVTAVVQEFVLRQRAKVSIVQGMPGGRSGDADQAELGENEAERQAKEEKD